MHKQEYEMAKACFAEDACILLVVEGCCLFSGGNSRKKAQELFACIVTRMIIRICQGRNMSLQGVSIGKEACLVALVMVWCGWGRVYVAVGTTVVVFQPLPPSIAWLSWHFLCINPQQDSSVNVKTVKTPI